MTWGIGRWLLMRFLGKLSPARIGELHKRVADEIQTTFAIDFTGELTLEKAITPSVIMQYNAKKIGENTCLIQTRFKTGRAYAALAVTLRAIRP